MTTSTTTRPAYIPFRPLKTDEETQKTNNRALNNSKFIWKEPYLSSAKKYMNTLAKYDPALLWRINYKKDTKTK